MNRYKNERSSADNMWFYGFGKSVALQMDWSFSFDRIIIKRNWKWAEKNSG